MLMVYFTPFSTSQQPCAAREDFIISRQMRVSKNDGRVYGKLRVMSLIFSMCTEKKLRLGERLAVGVQLTPERGNL